MDHQEYAQAKAKFLNLVASVPLQLRNEIIAVINNQAIDWFIATEEIKRDTEQAERIIKQLKNIGLL